MAVQAARSAWVSAGGAEPGVEELYRDYADALGRHLAWLGHEPAACEDRVDSFFVELLYRGHSLADMTTPGALPLGVRVWVWTELRTFLLEPGSDAFPASGAASAIQPELCRLEEPKDSGALALMVLLWQRHARRMDRDPLRAFLLLDVEGFSLEEAAAIEGVSEARVLERLGAARRELEGVFGLLRLASTRHERDPWKA